jgi:hypothetical protein
MEKKSCSFPRISQNVLVLDNCDPARKRRDKRRYLTKERRKSQKRRKENLKIVHVQYQKTG